MNPTHAFASAQPAVAAASPAGLIAELAARLAAAAPADGVHDTPIPGVTAIRASRPGIEQMHTLHRPALCVIAQGAKQVMLGDEAHDYAAGQFLAISVDLPVSGRVTRATPVAPYLCFRLDIDPALLTELLLKLPAGHPQRQPAARGLFVGEPGVPLLEGIVRLVRLLDEPAQRPLLAGLVVQEILLRLLMGEHGWRLAQGLVVDSQAGRVGRAIEWIKAHYAEPMRVAELARRVHMSASSLHHHFRLVTAMSPLQYQKQLRLQEARRLLAGGGLDVLAVANRVGYESPSQFSREYARLHGASPMRHVQQLRRAADAARA